MILDEEYKQIVKGILDSTPADFSVLCEVCGREIAPVVRYWCINDTALNGRRCEDDIMQDTMLRMMKYSVTGFFMRSGEEPFSRGKDEFVRWTFTVAKNVSRDYSRRMRRDASFDISALAECIGEEDKYGFSRESACVALMKAIDTVVSMRIGVHKIIVWLLVYITSINTDADRTKVIDALVRGYSNATLDEVRNELLRQFSRHEILRLREVHRLRLNELLDRPEGGKRLGDHRLCEFFSQSGGKYSISDWLYKTNMSLRRNTSGETSDV